MKTRPSTIVSCLAALFCLSLASGHPEHSIPVSSELAMESLLHSPLAGADHLEVFMSKVSIPPHSQLPKHWHPGEEFVYIVSGAVTLVQDGKDEVAFAAGDAGMVPLKQIHTARTGAEGVELIVFRVHEKGQPQRVLVENQ
ncbi:cupin domain-containing protein [Pelagicoccus sp. NFK12]|uniref:Cupin domain-containing protein n=1 Tax=Pelagicoccus enzymogenes TaxID=2773457 RepID=A0A927FDE4_9BACT|nr:cupin domain-containing protein [Pelagicoccus enzymogenes]MBD5782336.1 cupin domain-containing protein [Pelagicoccus enzymogenes]